MIKAGQWWQDGKKVPLLCKDTSKGSAEFAYDAVSPIAVSVPLEDIPTFWTPVLNKGAAYEWLLDHASEHVGECSEGPFLDEDNLAEAAAKHFGLPNDDELFGVVMHVSEGYF